MTIREFFENNPKEDDGWGGYVSHESINYAVAYFFKEKQDEFKRLAEQTNGWDLNINEDEDGDLYVCGNETAYKQYFEDDVPMTEVFEYIFESMNEEFILFTTER